MLRLAMVLGTAAAVALIVWALRWLLSGRAARHVGMLRQRFARFVPLAAALLVLFGDLAIDALGSFGLSDRSDAAWQAAAGLLTGPLYGGFEREGQDEIVIVAVDQEFISEHGGRWPPTYETMAALLNELTPAKPRVVFLDFYFSRMQSDATGQPDAAGLAALAASVSKLAAGGAKVFSGPIADLPGLAPLRTSGIRQVGLRGEQELAYAYPLRDERGWTAAPAIYSQLKGRPPKMRGDVLALEWGFGASKWVGDRSDRNWACVAGDLPSRVWNFIRLGFRAAAPAPNPDPETQGLTVVCPYFDVIPAGYLPYAEARERLERRVVMIGSTLPWVADHAESPLLGRVPGVTVHAMALDNLMEWRGEATVYPAKAFWGLDVGDVVQAGLLAFGFGLAARAHRRESDPRRRFHARIRVWAFVAALGIAIACLAAWPMFKLMSAVVIGSIFLEAWERLREFREEPAS